MKLKKATIHKYKSFENDQVFDVQDDITILVGMNESGKTSVLEAIAKTNYFQDDKKFKFNRTHDLPRRQKKAIDKSGVNPKAITCVYEIDGDLKKKIESRIGEGVFTMSELSVTTTYKNSGTWNNMEADFSVFIENQTTKLGIGSKTLNQ